MGWCIALEYDEARLLLLGKTAGGDPNQFLTVKEGLDETGVR